MTRVTRGTIDFQARDSLELRVKEFAKKFQVQSAKEAFKAEVSPTRHTRRTRRTPQLNSRARLDQSGFKAAFQARSSFIYLIYTKMTICQFRVD